MTQLELETRAVLTPLEILDWFYNLGFVVFDVRLVRKGEDGSEGKYFYQVVLGDAAADRALLSVSGLDIGGFPALVRQVQKKIARRQSGVKRLGVPDGI